MYQGSIPCGPSRLKMPHSIKIKSKCEALRKKGFSYNEISSVLFLPKTTVQNWVSNKVILTKKAKERIAKRVAAGQKRGVYSKYEGKYKGIYSKIVTKPKCWSMDLVKVIAHFLFDGGRADRSMVYYTSNKKYGGKLAETIGKIFNLQPRVITVKNNVSRFIYHSIDFQKYILRKTPALLSYINNARLGEKREFLKAFFDDEGNAFYDEKYGHHRIRGYQKDKKILILVKQLLGEFGIESKIERNELVISRKKDVEIFAKQINFSPLLFINPNRKNSVWKRKISKQNILETIIDSSK